MDVCGARLTEPVYTRICDGRAPACRAARCTLQPRACAPPLPTHTAAPAFTLRQLPTYTLPATFHDVLPRGTRTALRVDYGGVGLVLPVVVVCRLIRGSFCCCFRYNSTPGTVNRIMVDRFVRNATHTLLHLYALLPRAFATPHLPLPSAYRVDLIRRTLAPGGTGLRAYALPAAVPFARVRSAACLPHLLPAAYRAHLLTRFRLFFRRTGSF